MHFLQMSWICKKPPVICQRPQDGGLATQSRVFPRELMLLRIIPSIDLAGGGVRFSTVMSMAEKKSQNERFNRQLTTGGFRSTPQREHVYSVLLHKRDHPTAEEVFLRAKPQMPEISMATVYNCLDALVK